MGRHRRGEEHLENCPVCGCKALVRRKEFRGHSKFNAECRGCGLIAERKSNYIDAVKAWNAGKMLYPIRLTDVQEKSSKHKADKVEKYGCEFCCNQVTMDGQPFIGDEYKKVFCPFKDCPYKELLQEFDSFDDYFENYLFEFGTPFGPHTDEGYHLVF